ncbi:MAG: virulence protein SciE type [Leptolyngbya sp. PLA3]|nr:MAG: virulence protein SciE type [Cyanobacteria bacterium CYA]MCE7969175.1 virulence protein SciE type [Leptolyngbya sp. PL-A3]
MGTPARSAEDMLRAGRVGDAMSALRESIRSDPSDPKKRLFLFQLNCVLGDWEKALNQLNVAAELDPGVQLMARVGRAAIQCEVFRQDVFAGRRSPLLLGEPEPWVGLMLQAVQLSGQGRHAQASELRAQAFESAPARGGTLTVSESEEGVPHRFEWLADADERLGPMIEAIVDGKYYWVPCTHIRAIYLEPPSDLRDLVWAPATFRWGNGGEMVGLIPTRYPGSERSPDGSIALARKTEFNEVAPGTFEPAGQRMWATDAGEYPLLQTRRIEIDHADGPVTNG